MGELLGRGRCHGVSIGHGSSEQVLEDQIDVLIDFHYAPETTLAQRQRSVVRTAVAYRWWSAQPAFTAEQAQQLAKVPTVSAWPLCQGEQFRARRQSHLQDWRGGRGAGRQVDIEIVEAHHRHKSMRPRARRSAWAEVVAGSRHETLRKSPFMAERAGPAPEIATRLVSARIRAGDVVGDHTVIFAGDGERLEITHRASSRMAFAQGCCAGGLLAWEQPPGTLHMQDVLAATRRLKRMNLRHHC
jgi:4-hydroxy-tetrahydrodipicolinate reductase